MKKLLTIFALIIGASVTLFVMMKRTPPSDKKQYTIGILQTASHPALDAVRNGFEEELQKLMGNSVDIIFQNAQGSVTDAHTIAQRFKANKKINGLFAIATPAAQALGAVEKERPLVLAAVTNPESLGLIHPTTNVTGVRDMIDIPATVAMIQSLFPQAKRVGILYTTGEVNATLQADIMRKELLEHGLQPIDFAIASEADVPTVVQMATRKSDVLLAPTDHTVASTITIIASLALKAKTPLIVSDNMLVPLGALAARGVDYKDNGRQAAHSMYKLLTTDTKPYNLPIAQSDTQKIHMNEHVANTLGLSIDDQLKQDIVFV
jgi:putative ABC transport system substrate-binding protein